MSAPFQGVVAVSPERRLVALATENALEVRPMFGSGLPPYRITREFAPVAALVSAIEEARFVPGDGLYVRYLRGSEFSSTEETIPLSGDPATGR